MLKIFRRKQLGGYPGMSSYIKSAWQHAGFQTRNWEQSEAFQGQEGEMNSLPNCWIGWHIWEFEWWPSWLLFSLWMRLERLGPSLPLCVQQMSKERGSWFWSQTAWTRISVLLLNWMTFLVCFLIFVIGEMVCLSLGGLLWGLNEIMYAYLWTWCLA